jgi:hypothetical protein
MRIDRKRFAPLSKITRRGSAFVPLPAIARPEQILPVQGVARFHCDRRAVSDLHGVLAPLVHGLLVDALHAESTEPALLPDKLRAYGILVKLVEGVACSWGTGKIRRARAPRVSDGLWLSSLLDVPH